jgi:cytochrome P450
MRSGLGALFAYLQGASRVAETTADLAVPQIVSALHAGGPRDAFRIANGDWVISRHADVSRALQDRRLADCRWTAGTGGTPGARAFAALRARWFMQNDPPRQILLRKVIEESFAVRVPPMQERVPVIVDELLQAAQRAGCSRIFSQIAFPLSIAVSVELLGLPEEVKTRPNDWLPDFALLFHPYSRPDPDVLDSFFALHARMMQHVALRRGQLQDDVLSDLIRASTSEGPLPDDGIAVLMMIVFFAGFYTTQHVLAGGVGQLLENPEHLAHLRDDARMIAPAVEEMLRCMVTVVVAWRRVSSDMELNGLQLAAGDNILLHLTAANRDPAQFAAPERFDPLRRPNAHVTFSGGMHRCLGASLARMEGQALLKGLAPHAGQLHLRFPPNVRVIDASSVEAIELLWT